MSSKGFLFLSLAAILFRGAKRFLQFWLSKKHFYVIILKLGHWSRTRCHLKVYSIFSSGGHFHQWSETILAILVEGHPRNISVKLFEISLLV